MRHIDHALNPTPECLRNTKCRKWDDFGDNRAQVLVELVALQKGICAYCESRITDNKNVHAEHFYPQSSYPQKAFEWDNLFASCNGGGHGEHCGHHKGNLDPGDPIRIVVSPGDSDCQSYFDCNPLTGKVTANKQLAPQNQVKADVTINMLGLNSVRLVEKRKNILRGILGSLQVIDSKDEIIFKEEILNADPAGNLPEFFSAKEAVFLV